MPISKSSSLRLGFVVSVIASVAYTAACGGTADDTAFPEDGGSSDSTTGTDAGKPDSASDAGLPGNDAAALSDSSYCQALETRASVCDSGVVNDSKCHVEEACLNNVIRPAANAAYKNCVTGRACGVSDDMCVVEAGAPYLDAGPYDTYQNNCIAKQTTCLGQDAGFAVDNCSGVQAALVNDGAFGRLQGCIMQACPLVKSCIGTIFVEAGCN